MKLSIIPVLLVAVWTADFPGPKYLQPCESCGLSPVSLSLANAFAKTDITFSFRTTTELVNGCLELRLPLEFTIPNNTAYMIDQSEGRWRIQVPDRTYSPYNDYNFILTDVINPKNNDAYGPFSILTRSCCGCQVVDSSLNFHLLAITPAAAAIHEFHVSVTGTGLTIPIDSEVTITIDVPMKIAVDDKFWVKLDPMWRLPDAPACSFTCRYTKDRIVEVTEIYQQQQGFQITLRAILSPYSVPTSSAHSTHIWLLSPPDAVVGIFDNDIIYAEGKTTSPIAFSAGLLHMYAPVVQQAISSSSWAPMALVPEASELFVDVSLRLSHGLAGEGHRVEVLMSSDWQKLQSKPDCACWPKDSCYCGISPEESRKMIIYVVRSIAKDAKIMIRGKIDIHSSPLTVINAVSYDPKGWKIDECSVCSSQVLKAQSGLELLFQTTDLTGRQQLSTVGQLAMAQFIVMPPSADFIDGRTSQSVKATLVLPIQFALPKDFQYVYIKKHSTNFQPISDYHIQPLRPDITYTERNWRLAVSLSDSFPLYYGMFALMLANVTLPTTASNAELAYEARIELEIDQKTYLASDSVLIWPSPAVSVTAQYHCIGDLPSAPLEINITAASGAFLNEKMNSFQYFLELEFPISQQYGFPAYLGVNLTAGEQFPAYFHSSHERERLQNLQITADQDQTTLTMELNTLHARTWVVLTLAVGRKLGNKDVPVTIRAYNKVKDSFNMKNLIFEQVTLLKTLNPAPISTLSSEKLSLKVVQLGNKGTLELSIAEEADLKSLILVFPPNTGLNTLTLEPSVFRALYFPFQAFGTALLLEYSGEPWTERLSLTLGGVSFKQDLAGFITILAAESFSKAAICPLLLQFEVPSQPQIASIACSVCADLFSPRKVRDKLQVDFTITHGIAEGTTLVAEFDPIWGLNYTKCVVNGYSIQSKCRLSVKERSISVSFLQDIRENPFILQVSLRELRQPKEKMSSADNEIGDLFRKVTFWYSESRFSEEKSASMVYQCVKSST